jgi:drug/metabolite transporter (DMT)-like permease
VKQSALARLALLALIWGSAFLWIKLAIRGFSPVEVTFARLALGAAVLFPIVLARRESLPRTARMWGHITVAALFANAIPYLLFAVAEQTVASSTAGIINATTPLWTVLLALAVRHQKSVTSWQAAGLIVGFGGALLIFSPWGSASAVTSAGGLECLAASVSYAISYIYMDRYVVRRGLSPITLSACQLLAAAIMLAIALAIVGAPAPHPSAVSVAGVAILGIIGTGIAYVLNYQIIASEGATIASTVTYLLPVVAIVLGVLVLGENITAMILAGIALVLAGVALTRHHPKAATEP